MNWDEPKVYAVKHLDENVINQSRSGGIFTAISDYILEQNGVVYGCILDQDFKAVHMRAENSSDRNMMRGSKYIQSRLGDTYRNVKKDLLDNKFVLFTGTSCQVDGLLNYLGKEYVNLLCVDIVCHGVPSPKVWDKYLQWQKKANRSEIRSVSFRNKKDFGWRDHKESIYLANGKSVDSKIYTKLFYDHHILRPCCYKCKYKSIMHPADITIADYWGIEKAAPEFDDNKGVSLVLINNEIGERIFELIKSKINWKETRIEDSMQPPLEAPFPEPEGRELFWNEFNNKKFGYIAKKYCQYGYKEKIKSILGKMKRKLIK